MISRKSWIRSWPRGCGLGNSGSIRAHSASVRSVGYGSRFGFGSIGGFRYGIALAPVVFLQLTRSFPNSHTRSHCFALFIEERRLLAFNQQGREHTRNAEIAAVHQAEACQGI